jgi:integrase
MRKSEEMSGLYTQERAHGVAWYFSRRVNGTRQVFNLETSDLTEAIKRRKEIISREELNTSGLLSVEIKRYVRWQIDENGSSEFTEAKFTSFLRRLVRELGDIPVIQVVPKDGERYRKALEASGLVSESVRTYLGHARMFLEWCVKPAGMIRTNPFNGLEMPEKRKQLRKQWVKPWDSNKLIQACQRDDLRFVLYCGFYAGMRRNEIVHARPSWFDLHAKVINITLLYPPDAKKLKLDPFEPKDKTERTIPISDEFAEFLKGYLKPEWDYCIGQGRRQRTKSGYRYDFRRPYEEFMEAQNFGWCMIHLMRHSYASMLYSSGKVSSAIITEWTGDEERVLNEHYKHLIPRRDLLHEALESFKEIKPITVPA